MRYLWTFFHVKCCDVNHRTYNSVKQSNNDWHCKRWTSNVSNTDELSNGNRVDAILSSKEKTETTKKCKCGKCKKNIPTHLRVINCDKCKAYFHVKCSGTNKNSFLDIKRKNGNWVCFGCVTKEMPFSCVDNNELLLEMENKANLINSTPSFTIQSPWRYARAEYWYWWIYERKHILKIFKTLWIFRV